MGNKADDKQKSNDRGRKPARTEELKSREQRAKSTSSTRSGSINRKRELPDKEKTTQPNSKRTNTEKTIATDKKDEEVVIIDEGKNDNHDKEVL